MQEQKDALAILTRYPEPGSTKTRLIPALGAQGAADLHYRMLEHVLHLADVLHEQRDVQVRIFHAGGSQQAFRELLGHELCYVEQSGESLGERMENAFQLMFEQGCAKAVLIGSDCPGLEVSILEEAFRALDTADVVFGPAWDGGYYLLGLT
ncbi:MAG: TIGR04282 family arsenosugar biosynthesis glycosyltransferase, partial [Desulfohalobiaceae bacterium]|nr:TIGR04282 family arsenosugar biosynthesis glycosyltransferase [Desulfohalobiaceae bacterium]